MKKKKYQECFCALCRSPRKLRYSRRLQSQHFIQIFVLTIGLAAALYPWLEWKGAAALPIIWASFDWFYKSLYRKDLKCPFCGFDPTWYKKDVSIARKQVLDFLKQNPESPVLKRVAQSDIFQHPRQ
jgi:hypothetical protein